MFDLVSYDKTFDLLEKTLDLASARHSLIASNLANVDTPGYKATDLVFKRELEIILRQTERNEMALGSSGEFIYKGVLRPRIVEVTGVIPRQDGNTVSIDRELGNLAQTNGLFSKAIKMYSMKLKMLRTALRGD